MHLAVANCSSWCLNARWTRPLGLQNIPKRRCLIPQFPRLSIQVTSGTRIGVFILDGRRSSSLIGPMVDEGDGWDSDKADAHEHEHDPVCGISESRSILEAGMSTIVDENTHDRRGIVARPGCDIRSKQRLLQSSRFRSVAPYPQLSCNGPKGYFPAYKDERTPSCRITDSFHTYVVGRMTHQATVPGNAA